MKKLFFLFIFISASPFFAQVGIGTSTPSPSAMLDVQSNSAGVLIPRMEAIDRDNIISPAKGLLVFVNDDNSFYYYDSTNWIRLGNGFGDDGDWTVNGNDLYSAVSGNVGIGNNMPEFKLDIEGDVRHGNNLYLYSNKTTGYNIWANFNSPDNGNGDNVFIGAGGTTVLGSGESINAVKGGIDTTNGHETLYVSSDNNFRIITALQEGWDNRNDVLVVDKDRDWHMDFSRIYLHNFRNGNNNKLFIHKTNNDRGYGMGMSIGPGQSFAIGSGESAHAVYNNLNLEYDEIFYLTSDKAGTSQAIKFLTGIQNGWDNRIEAMTIMGNGNVGIGTTIPSQKLDINGVMHLEPSTEPSNPTEGDIYMDSSSHKLRVYDGTTWHDLW